jgi:hypothetical protein
MRHRRFPIRAGHRDDRSRLPAVEPRREQCQTALRIGVDNDRHAAARLGIQRQRAGIVGQDRDGAACDRLACESAAIATRAAQRGEQKTGLDPARIGGDPGDLGIAG